MRESLARCSEAVHIINHYISYTYYPLLLSLPSYGKLLQEELIDHRTLASKQELLDNWQKFVIPLPKKSK